MAKILETIMLVCFGLSWPINMVKAYKAGTAKSTSLPFILLIITGYVAGTSAKIINGGCWKNYVFYVYILNLVIVMLNLAVYFRNRHLDKQAELAASKNAENGVSAQAAEETTEETTEA